MQNTVKKELGRAGKPYMGCTGPICDLPKMIGSNCMFCASRGVRCNCRIRMANFKIWYLPTNLAKARVREEYALLACQDATLQPESRCGHSVIHPLDIDFLPMMAVVRPKEYTGSI